MTTTASILRDEIIAALRSPTVASAAGIAHSAWADSVTPRVFDGRTGYIGGRNRGRTPFIEVWINTQGFNHTTLDGGTVVSEVLIRAHATGRSQEVTLDRLGEIIAESLVAIRSVPEHRYTAQGADRVDAAKPGPMGFAQDAIVTIEHSYDRGTYERA